MNNIERIIRDVKEETARTDKQFKGIIFEERKKEITMFFEYEETVDNVTEDQNFVRHNHDPEWIDKKRLPELEKHLKELNVAYQIRRDIFI